MKVRYNGQLHTFPDGTSDDEVSAALQSMEAQTPSAGAASTPSPEPPSEFDQELAALTQKYQGKPLVPRGDAYKREDIIAHEARSNVDRREREAAEKKLYESRNAGERVRDTAAFAASVLPRTLTRGEYGAGDIAGALGYEETAKRLAAGEQDFAWANQAGLEAAAAAGEVTAGIPFLSTMGAVPGQVLRTGGAAARDFPRQARNFMKDERGALILPGKGHSIPKGAPTTVDDIAATLDEKVLSGSRAPSRKETIDAGERINRRLPEGERFTVPKAIAGNAMERSLAGGLEAIPYVGSPVTNAVEQGLFGLNRAKEAATESLGTPGQVGAGSGLRSRITDWMKSPTAGDMPLGEMYDKVDALIKKDVPVNLQNIRNQRDWMAKKAAASTTKEYDQVIAIIDEMLDPKRFPKGMGYQALKEKRTEVRGRMSGNIVNEAGTSQKALERLYGALGKDMRFAIERAGGKKALDAFEEANTAAQNVAEKRKLLEGLVGSKGQHAPEKVVARLREMGRSKRGDLTLLRLVKQTASKPEWDDLAATFADELGVNPKGDFSIARFTSDWGRFSDGAKRLLFGEEGKAALDDIALVAKRFEKLPINTSKTGTVNAVLHLLMNPITAAGAGAALLTDIGTLGSGAGTLAGLRMGRSMAWNLAKPATTREASKVFKAYYLVAKGGEGIAAKEKALSQALRSYATSMAAETGGNAEEIARAMEAKLAQIRRAERNGS